MPIAFGSLKLTPDEFYCMTMAEFEAACIGLMNEKKEWLQIECRKMHYALVGKVKHPPKPQKIYDELTKVTHESPEDNAKIKAREALSSATVAGSGGRNPKDNARRLAQHIRSRNGN